MNQEKSSAVSRRDFVKGAGSAVLATAAGLSLTEPVRASTQERYNILMIVTDQESYMAPSDLPAGYQLPAHEKLATGGIVFENHQIASCVCTPSRAVMYTGLHIQNNGMFDNTNFPWSTDLSTDIPTVGDQLRSLGYYTAYKGKWHLSDKFETANDLHMPKRLLSEEMEEYGFSDYFGIGDMIAHTEGGYLHDGVIASMTKSWLRGKAKTLEAEQKPWFMAVNLINPHDVMYYNTDLAGGTPAQASTAMMRLNHEPHAAQFSKQWQRSLPESRSQAVSGPHRPPAHEEYANARSALVGRVPNEDDRWRRLNDYYLNCIQSVDRHVSTILGELDDVGLADKTIVIYTSDHGELAGAHGLNGKGATAYREQNNVPFIVSHPGFPGNRRCKAVTSHLDIAATLLAMAGGGASAKTELPGVDISPVFADPEAAGVDAVRPGALFNYNMLAFLDGEFLMNVSDFIRGGGKPSELPDKGWKPNLANRGAIRSVFDGRYKLNRYFSPQEHHVPRSMEELFANNDVELFDLSADPLEVNNLASDRRGNGELLIAMNDKLNALLAAEVGDDSGLMLPDRSTGNWALDADISKLRM
jgi:arylsulfatase